MKLLGFKTVYIKELVLPPDIPDRMERPDVKALADTIDEIGLLHPPTIRESDYKLIAGGDRIAACILSHRDQVLVQLADCSDEEIPRLEIIENYHRRHDTQARHAVLQAVVEQLEGEIEEPEKPKRGPRMKKKTRAIEKTIQESGLSRATVYRALQKKDEVFKFSTFGLPLDDEFKAEMTIIQSYVDKARVVLRQVTSQMTSLVNSGTSVSQSHVDRVGELVTSLRKILDEMYPASLCPWCKGVEEYQQECAACLTTGWVGKESLKRAPAELLDEKNLCVSVGGQIQVLDPVSSEEIGDLW